MKVAFITPYYLQSTRGNAVTVRRLEHHLTAAGCQVRVFSREAFAGTALVQGIREFGPDCLHAFHALHGGVTARQVCRELGIPYLVTLTGTDLYGGEADDMAAMVEALAGAEAVVIFHETVRQRLLRLLPHPAGQIAVIPQGVDLPDIVAPEATGDFVFFLPAGIRPVKNVLFPVAPLARLHAAHPRLRLRVAGPLLDESYCRRVLAAFAAAPFVDWLGEVAFEAMAGQYAASHVVLNTSVSEGGMANSLLEAMAAGRPVLAADIEGNRSLVEDGVNGLLYHGEADFLDKAERLLNDLLLRQRLGLAGREYVREQCSPERESAAYRHLYHAVTGQSKPTDSKP